MVVARRGDEREGNKKKKCGARRFNSFSIVISVSRTGRLKIFLAAHNFRGRGDFDSL